MPSLLRPAFAFTSALALSLGCGSSSSSPGAQTPAVPPGTQEVPVAVPGSFADNPIVYFAITDRFLDGDPSNNRSYGRAPDGENEIGTFHGGDLRGLTKKLDEGYFKELGVNALWITAPYQQILGWVIGGNKEFRHYAYHGYYALDFTVLDANMGTEDDLRRLVDTAHSQGIRVLFDVVMNHPGYADLASLNAFGIEVTWPGWEKATPQNYGSFIDYNDFDFVKWWGPKWVRADLPGYTPGSSIDDREKQLAYLPDFRTDSKEPVDLPPFLAKKKDTKAVARPGFTVRAYLVEWLTRWVRDFGIDGFRCDTAKHVDFASWEALKAGGTAALAIWKQQNPNKKIDDAGFWMTGEVFPHNVIRSEYFDHGFDNIINFDFQARAKALGANDWAGLDAIYAEYATALGAGPRWNVLSYLSSHDTELFPRDRLVEGGTKLLLAPGGVQIFYGDEAARPLGPAASSDPQQGTRSSMRWDRLDEKVLAHFRALGSFRKRHVALSLGAHKKLGDAPYTFARTHGEGDQQDRVVVALGASGDVSIPVASVFADGERVRDAITGTTVTVTAGAAALKAGERGVILLERVRAQMAP